MRCIREGQRAGIVQRGLFSGLVLAAVAAMANGQTMPATQPAQEIVVTADRLETPLSQVGSDVTVITSKQIDQKQQPLVADVLRTVPGLDVVRYGGPGQPTSVFMRGARSEHTLVLIDGIPSNDPSSPAGTFNFSTLTTGNIERIEVIRGPQSTVWGSRAMGGVINIITKGGQIGPPRFYYQQEVGSYSTFRESAGASGATKKFSYSLAIDQNDSKGFSAADQRLGNHEPDGYSITSGSGKFGLNLAENADVGFVFRALHSTVAYDNTGGPPGVDSFGNPTGDSYTLKTYTEEQFARIQPRIFWLDGAVESVFGASISHIRRRFNDPNYGEVDDGLLSKFDLQNNIKIGSTNILTVGGDYTIEDFQSDPRGSFAMGTSRQEQTDTGVFIQDQQRLLDCWTVTGGFRHDETSNSGSNNSYRLSTAYELKETNTELRASYGTGFRPPTLYQQFNPFVGSTALRPEESEGWDVGLEQWLIRDKYSVGATYFHNNFKNLIAYDPTVPPFGAYNNVTAARTQGVEAFIAARPINDVSLRLSYTYTDINSPDYLAYVRRAPHKVALNATWQFMKNADVTMDAVYYSERPDVDPINGSHTTSDEYVLVNLAASYQVCKNCRLFGRIDNLLNQNYEEVKGFGTSSLAFYGGMRIEF